MINNNNNNNNVNFHETSIEIEGGNLAMENRSGLKGRNEGKNSTLA